jgi:hypothetical protein
MISEYLDKKKLRKIYDGLRKIDYGNAGAILNYIGCVTGQI